MTVPIHEIERQQRWEAMCVEEGIKRFKRKLAGSTLSDAPGGIRIIGETIGSLTDGITAAQKEAIAGVTSGSRVRQAPWWWLLPVLPAQTLAFITLKVLLTFSQHGSDYPSELAVSFAIGEAVRMELEFTRWKAAESEKAGADPQYRSNLLYALTHVRHHGGVNQRNYARWLKKAEQVEKIEWARDQKVQVGAKLLLEAVTHSGGWFELKVIRKNGRPTRRVKLTDEALAALKDIHAAAEVNRPFLAPMRCPPKPWVRVEPAGV